MGSSYSEPVPDSSTADLGVFAVCLSPSAKVRLIHAPQEVISVTGRIVNRLNSLYIDTAVQTEPKVKDGVLQYKLGFSAFIVGNSKDAATLGKLFCLQMFEELYKLGYDLVLSSDLARTRDQSTWFVKKVASERPSRKVACIAPSKSDTLALLNYDERIKNKVFEAIAETWPDGYAHGKDINIYGQQLFQIKLNGYPWLANESEVDSKRLLSCLVGKMGEINMKLLVGTNIKGGTDSLFFMEDMQYMTSPHHFCTISLCSHNRIRLVDCKDMAYDVRETILQNVNEIKEESIKEHHHKFRIKGSPWWCSGEEAVKARRLISRIGETMLRKGWALTDAVDLSRGLDDKSVLLYRQCQPTASRFSCIALTDVDHLRLIDFPHNDQETLKSVITKSYFPGIERHETEPSDFNCVKMTLSGNPWAHMGVYALHGRSMLVHLLSRAIQLGYMVVASADVSAKYQTDSDGNPDYPLDVHTWYLVKYQL